MTQGKKTADLSTLESFAKKYSQNGVSKLTLIFKKNRVSVSCKKSGRHYGGAGTTLHEAYSKLEKKLITI